MTGDFILHLGELELYRGPVADFEFEIFDGGVIVIMFHVGGQAYSYGGTHISWIFTEEDGAEPGKAS